MGRISERWGRGFAAVIAALAFLPATASAQDDACLSELAGTYLVTITKSDGAFASRAIIALDDNGNLLITDSNELPDKFGIQKGSSPARATAPKP